MEGFLFTSYTSFQLLKECDSAYPTENVGYNICIGTHYTITIAFHNSWEFYKP